MRGVRDHSHHPPRSIGENDTRAQGPVFILSCWIHSYYPQLTTIESCSGAATGMSRESKWSWGSEDKQCLSLSVSSTDWIDRKQHYLSSNNNKNRIRVPCNNLIQTRSFCDSSQRWRIEMIGANVVVEHEKHFATAAVEETGWIISIYRVPEDSSYTKGAQCCGCGKKERQYLGICSRRIHRQQRWL